jgi:molecular chaperone DnaJ
MASTPEIAMLETDPYKLLGLDPQATQAQVKKAYRLLAKQYHPDRQDSKLTADERHEWIVAINGAYEILGDVQRRQEYDRHRQWGGSGSKSAARSGSQSAARSRPEPAAARQERAAKAQEEFRRRGNEDDSLAMWMKQVFNPINRLMTKILTPLKQQISDLSADPYDDELMEAFQAYLKDCRRSHETAQKLFRSAPNPRNAAGTAAQLYYCLNAIGDGIDELVRFSYNYDESYLHSGKEMFRTATRLRKEAVAAAKMLG